MDASTSTLDDARVRDDARVPNDGAAADASTGDSAVDAATDAQSDAYVEPRECPEGCDDGIECTEDECISGRCSHLVAPDACGEQEVCNLNEGGCVPRAPCAVLADCADDDPCTRDEVCNQAQAFCSFTLLDADEDGHVPLGCGGDDFDDGDPIDYPGAPDICDAIDNDEDGMVDEEPEATASCSGGTRCEEGHCPLCLGEADQTILNQLHLMTVIGLCAQEPNPKVCRSQFGAELPDISRNCFVCFVRAAECVRACSLAPTLDCPSSAGPRRDCIEACQPVFDDCAGPGFEPFCL